MDLGSDPAEWLLEVLLHVTVALLPTESGKSAWMLGKGWGYGHTGKLQNDLLGRYGHLCQQSCHCTEVKGR